MIGKEQDTADGGALLPSPIMRLRIWIVPLIYAMSVIAFVIDLERANSFAYGIIYAPLIATAVFHRSRQFTWILAALASVMVVVGAFFPFVAPNLPDLIANRVLSIIAIFATAMFIDYARVIQDRLAEQTRRAEAAEHIKTEVFANLSVEMRAPLQSLLSLLSLLMAGARADQAEAIERIDTGARQLLASMDNLIELTQVDDRHLVRQSVDLAAVAYAAAHEAASAAREHEVVVQVSPMVAAMNGASPAETGGASVGHALALGDPWAVRRIMDNLIQHFIFASEPGEVVSVAVRRTGGDIVVSVYGPVAVLAEEMVGTPLERDDADRLSASGATGMALSQRLASRMNGRLMWAAAPNDADIFSLCLPAA